MKACPLVSVIIPVYNPGQYLQPCLDSVIRQTLSDIEILCVDDGSTDDSPAILQEYAASDPRIHIIRQENSGPGAARNTGIRAATGKYICFTDSDDYLEPDALEVCSSAMERNSLEFLCFNAEAFDEDEKSFRRAEDLNSAYFRRTLKEGRVFSGLELFTVLREEKHLVISPCTVMTLRSFLLEHQLWFHTGILMEDESWTMSVLFHAARVGCVNRVLYHYRIHLGSVTHSDLSFAHPYGYFVACRTLQEKAAGLKAPVEKRLEKALISKISSLQQSAIRMYLTCDSTEKAKRLCLPTEERLDFERLVVFPAAQTGRLERLQTELDKERQRSDRLQQKLQKLKASWFCRVGSAFTRVFLKIKKLLKY